MFDQEAAFSRPRQLRDLMATVDPSSKDTLARLWREAYVDVPDHALHRMHAIAFEHGIGLETAGEWIDESDLGEFEPSTDTSGKVLPCFGVTKTDYYRGFAIHTSVIPAGAAWSFKVEAESDAGEILFQSDDAPFETIEEAFRTAVTAAMHAIHGIAD